MNQRVVESNQEDQKRKQQPEGYIIKDIRNLFKLIEENDVIKDRIIRDIRNLFEKEENCLKPLRLVIFIVTIIMNVKVVVIEIKHY